MKKPLYILIFLFSLLLPFVITCNLASAQLIDGPANIRDAPKGTVLLSLDDGINVAAIPFKDNWFFIRKVFAVHSDALADPYTIKKNAPLFDIRGNKIIGRSLHEWSPTSVAVVENYNEPGQLYIYMLEAYTYIGNIKPTTLWLKYTPPGVSYRTRERIDKDFERLEHNLAKLEEYSSTATNLAEEYVYDICTTLESLKGAQGQIKFKDEHLKFIADILSSNSHIPVRQSAAEFFQGTDYELAINEEIIPVLVNALNNTDDTVKLSAVKALLNLGASDKILPTVYEYIDNGKIGLDFLCHKYNSPERLSVMKTYVSSGKAALKAAAIDCLVEESLSEEDQKNIDFWGAKAFETANHLLKKKNLQSKGKTTSDRDALEIIISTFSKLKSPESRPLLEKIAKVDGLKSKALTVLADLKNDPCINPASYKERSNLKLKVKELKTGPIARVRANEKVTVPLNLKNENEENRATLVEIRIFGPDRYSRHFELVPIIIPPGGSAKMNYSYRVCPGDKEGLWSIEYALLEEHYEYYDGLLGAGLFWNTSQIAPPKLTKGAIFRVIK